jgi:hypothetical protein
MAGILSRADAQLLAAHLGRFPKQAACPVCGGTRWQPQGFFGSLPVEEGRVQMVGQVYMVPTVILICEGCGYIRQFAWNAIKKGPAGRANG